MLPTVLLFLLSVPLLCPYQSFIYVFPFLSYLFCPFPLYMTSSFYFSLKAPRTPSSSPEVNNQSQFQPALSFPPDPSPPQAGKGGSHILSRALVCPRPTGSQGGMRKLRGKGSRMCLLLIICNFTPSTSGHWNPKVFKQ